jgi:hypothetical protein
VKLTSAVKTLISGATSRYITFTHIVARRYHRKFAAAATITIKPKKVYLDAEKLSFKFKGTRPFNFKK